MSIEAKHGVDWLNSLDEGMARARATGLPVLLDFFNPG
jgi:hypothetical protein